MSEEDYQALERSFEKDADRLEQESEQLEEHIVAARREAKEARQPHLPGIVPEPDSEPEINATYPNKRPAEES